MNLWQRIVNLVARPRPDQARIHISAAQAGVVVNEDTALTFSAVWACVSVISRTIAALPWQVLEKTSKGREPVDGQISWLLNNQPNPEMTGFSFRELLMVHVLTWGNAYAEIQRDLSGRVVALWPISPDRVQPMRNDAGQLVYRIRDADGNNSELTPDRMLHLHGMGFDGLSGYSPVRMAARSVGVGIAQDVFAQAFYANGTVFGTLIEMGGSMNPDQIANAEKYHNDKGRGPGRAFSTKVAPLGTKVHSMSMPMTDAQFLETRKFSVTEICRWYGVPPHKVADLDRSTNNNIEHQGIEFVTDAILPWTVRLEQEANVKLFAYRAQGRIYTKLTLNALMRGDAASRANFYRLMTQMGAMTINEVREMEDMNGIGTDGDVQLVQLNQTTLEQLVKAPPTGAPATAAPPADDAPEPAKPTNVIRTEALDWQRKHA